MIDIANIKDVGNKIIQEKLGLNIPNTSIEILNRNEWNLLLQRRKIANADGIYFPRIDAAYFSEDVSIPVFVHEYFGHGLFCEQSRLGNQLRRREVKLGTLEAKLDKKSSKKVDEYVNKKEETEAFVEEYRPVYEGFAIWLEDLILRRIDEDLWTKRKDLHRLNTTFFEKYERMKRVEEAFGPLSVIYGLEFPKNLDRTYLLKLVKENIGDAIEDIEFLFSYGSRKAHSDVDLIAVFGDEVQIDEVNKFTGDFDMAQLKRSDFLNRLFCLDIEETEPVWTGQMLIGEESFEPIERCLEVRSLDKVAETHIRRRSLENFNSGLYFRNMAQYEKNGFVIQNCDPDFASGIVVSRKTDFQFESKSNMFSLVNLSYALSYDSSLQRYQNGERKVIYRDMLKDPKSDSDLLLGDLHSYLKDLKRNNETIKDRRIEKFLEQARRFLS